MRRSPYRRQSKVPWMRGRRRIIAAAATVVAFGAIVTVTQISDASSRRPTQRALAACDNLRAPAQSRLSSRTRQGTWTTNGGRVTQHADDGAGDVATTAELRRRCRSWVMQHVANNGSAAPAQSGSGGGTAPAATQQPGQNNTGGQNTGGQNTGGQNTGGQNTGGQNTGGQNTGGQNTGGQNAGGQNTGGQNTGGNAVATPPPGAGLGVLANSCATSRLQGHDGFQKGDRCVSTQFGEVGSAANNPSLLITQAPRAVGVNQPFTLQVSTRNLIRDRFLAAGQGGYYVESSVLQGGLVRGHFHTACRMLNNTAEAPDAAPVPAFFVATEDKRGGRTPDQVTIQVPGMPTSGTAQCASWAGDGSHRIPMMERANQTPAFDAVRIQVGSGR